MGFAEYYKNLMKGFSIEITKVKVVNQIKNKECRADKKNDGNYISKEGKNDDLTTIHENCEGQEIEKYDDFLKEFGGNYEQKRAVVSNSRRILVLAGAGSGKTKVLTKRFVHLVKNKNVPLSNITALTFTKEAANEMKRIIIKELGCSEESIKSQVRTFHSFGLSILRRNEQFDVLDESGQRDIIMEILVGFKDDAEILGNLHDYIMNNIVPKVKEKENETNREPQFKNKVEDFGQRRIKTNSGILVKSKSERDIANFLTLLGLDWEYEKPVEWADSTFKPDFTIENEVYIEHWCYNDKTVDFSGINKKKYLEHRKWKENQFIKHDKRLISIEESEMYDLLSLQNRLTNELSQCLNKKVEKKDIFDLLCIEPVYKNSFEKFVEELIEIINLIKSLHLNIDEVKKRVDENGKEKILNFYAVLIPIMQKYENILKHRGYSLKDFNDLIKDAVFLLKKDEKKKEYYREKVKYLLIDEYQDVSFGDVELLKLITTKNTNIFAVGDDWQSIYGWRGSSVDFILNFDRDFGEYEKIILPINYRCPKNVINASSTFIQLKGNHYKKNIRCCKERENDDSRIIQVNANNDFGAARYIMSTVNRMLYQNSELKPSDFLILYRSRRIMYPYKKAFVENEFRILQKTIHWSKGSEHKYVFVLGLKKGIYGFPNVYADKDIKRIILDNSIEEKEEEERRLFYVAMTRAKEKLFLISEKGNESEYVQEIPLNYKYIVERPPK